jgi:hypothetical protein
MTGHQALEAQEVFKELLIRLWVIRVGKRGPGQVSSFEKWVVGAIELLFSADGRPWGRLC